MPPKKRSPAKKPAAAAKAQPAAPAAAAKKPAAARKRARSSSQIAPPKPPRTHRCGFWRWAPSDLTALAAKRGSVVAAARADGSFELVDGAARWTSVAKVSGRRDAAATSLAWVAGRCYGATASGIIFEADFDGGRVHHETDGLGGAVWQLLADARAPARLDACCDDGSIRVFECDEQGALSYTGALRVATGARCLCAAWAELGDSRALFAGCDDGTLRRIDSNTGRSSLRLTVDGDAPRVWSVATLCDATSCTVASGDSTGAVCLWDGVVGSLLRRFARHDADVLCVAIAGDCVFAAGADSKVVCLERHADEWSFAAAHRPHVLDVRALCVSEDAEGRPTLLSGALDAKLCAYAASNGRSLPTSPPPKQRRRSRSTTADDPDDRNVPWTFSTLYSPLLAATWLGDEILVAENPWLAIARQQTVSAVARRKYGV